MSRREDIDNAIWDDEDFDELSNDAALLYLWSFTNPRCGMAGLYRVKRRHIAEGRLEGDALAAALDELEASGHVYYRDGYLWVRSRVKHLRTKGRPMQTSIARDVLRLPVDHPLRSAFCDEYRHSWAADAVAKIEVSEGDQEGAEGGSRGVPKIGSDKPDEETPSEPLEGLQGKGYGNGKGPGTRPSTTSVARAKVAGKVVTDAERELAAAIVAAFNDEAGSGFTLDAHLTPIVGRIREHPELDADAHRHLIARNFADPWWRGRPRPNVIYGNAGAFEGAIEKAKGGPAPPRLGSKAQRVEDNVRALREFAAGGPSIEGRAEEIAS